MTRPHDGEVPAVKGRDLIRIQAFCGRHDRGIDGSEWEIAITRDELCDAQPVSGRNRLDAERASGEIAKEADLGLRTKSCTEQVSDLGHHKHGDEERTGMVLEKVQRRDVIAVIGVDVGIQRTGVDE